MCFNTIYYIIILYSSRLIIVLYAGHCVRFFFIFTRRIMYAHGTARVFYIIYIFNIILYAYEILLHCSGWASSHIMGVCVCVCVWRCKPGTGEASVSAFSHTSHTCVTYEWCPLRHLRVCVMRVCKVFIFFIHCACVYMTPKCKLYPIV